MAQTVSSSEDRALRDPERLRALTRTELLHTGPHAELDRWTALTTRLVEAPMSVLTLLDDRREYVKSVSGGCGNATPGDHVPLSHSLCREVVATGAPLVIADAASDPLFRAHPAILAYGIGAYAGVPVRDADGHVLGALCALDTEARPWSLEDIDSLTSLAAAIELELARAAAERDVKRLQHVLACEHLVHELIVAGAPLSETLGALIEGVESQADGMRGSVLLCDPTGRHLHHAASPNLPAACGQALDGLDIGPDVGCCGTAAHTGSEVVVEDIAADDRWEGFKALAAEHDLAACWSTPILSPDHGVVGTFAFYDSVPRAPRAGELSLIRHASRLAGIAIERHRNQERLVAMAEVDALTGLANRNRLLRHMRETVSESVRADRSLAVLFCDLNRFKLINDSLGHVAGDLVLETTARRLESCAGPDDVVARLGGDEFVVLATGIDAYQARGFAGRVRRRLAQPIVDPLTGTEHRITASIGVALDDGVSDADDLIRHADAAMFTAKSCGTGVAFYASDSRDTATRELELHSALRGALDSGELHVVYQPVVDLSTGAVASAEALIRWTHPTLGQVSPADFIPVAERHGLIADIGDWVLRTAGLHALDWNELSGRPVPVAVNVSPRQLTDPYFAERVAEILGSIRLSPPLLTLEITETALVHDDVATLRNLEALAQLGVRIALDDFGTGYSSLSHLRRLPISSIKVDRSFIDGLNDDGDDTAIVTGVIGMARGLSLETVAEGVETDAQVTALERLGCDYGQGYRFARPLDVPGITALVARALD